MKGIRTLVGSALLAWGVFVQAETAMIQAPWIREAPPNAQALAGFMTVMNHGTAPLILVDASSPAFGEVQLHRTVVEGGMAKMVRQSAIEIPAGGTQKFEPGGYHLMLMSPRQPLREGDRAEVTLVFKDGEKQAVSFPVKAAGGPDHERAADHMHHH